MTWRKDLNAWATEEREQRPGSVIMEIEETLVDGWTRGTEMRISRAGLKLILLAIRIAQYI